MPLLHLPAA